MSDLINRLAEIINRFISDRRGFSLVELMIVLSLLAIILSLVFNFYLFGIRSFNIGEEQSDVQQNARLAAGFITKELRIAERVVIVNEYEDLAALDTESQDEFYIYHIYIDEGSIYYQKLDGLEESAAILDGISDNIEFELAFRHGKSKDNLLQLNLSAVNVESGRTYNLETEILVLNVGEIEDLSDGVGLALLYQVPAPPDPAIISIIIEPQAHEYAPDGQVDILVNTFTKNVNDHNEIAVEFWSLEDAVTGSYIVREEGTMVDNFAQTILTVDRDLPVGDYYVEVIVEDINYSQIRYYYNYPLIHYIDITPRPGEPFFGDVSISTSGVPQGIEATVELVLIDEEIEQILTQPGDFSFHHGSPIVDASGLIEFGIKLGEEFKVGNQYIVRVKIGRLVKDSTDFIIIEEEVAEEEVQ